MFPFGKRQYGRSFGNHPSGFKRFSPNPMGFNPFRPNPMGFNPFDFSNQLNQQQHPFQSGFFNHSPFQPMQQPFGGGFGQPNPGPFQQLFGLGQANPGPMQPPPRPPNQAYMNPFQAQPFLGPGQFSQGIQSLFKNDKGQYDLVKIGNGVQQVIGVVNQVGPLMKMFGNMR